jgi:hypothetical protein
VNYYPSSAHVKEERDGEERDGEGGLWRDLNQIVSLRIQVYEGLKTHSSMKPPPLYFRSRPSLLLVISPLPCNEVAPGRSVLNEE